MKNVSNLRRVFAICILSLLLIMLGSIIFSATVLKKDAALKVPENISEPNASEEFIFLKDLNDKFIIINNQFNDLIEMTELDSDLLKPSVEAFFSNLKDFVTLGDWKTYVGVVENEFIPYLSDDSEKTFADKMDMLFQVMQLFCLEEVSLELSKKFGIEDTHSDF